MQQENGKVLTRRELRVVLHNFSFSHHAIERLKDRNNNLVVNNYKGTVDFLLTKENVIDEIENNLLIAYCNTDGSVNVAINEFNYYVFEPTKDSKYFPYVWTMVTFKEPSENKINIFEKWDLAKNNIDRKEN